MIFMVGAGLFQPLLCKDKGSLVNIQRTFINLINFISLRLGSIVDNHLIFFRETYFHSASHVLMRNIHQALLITLLSFILSYFLILLSAKHSTLRLN